MEKTIYIDEQPIPIKSTAATALRYKAQFGKDYFAEIMKLYPLAKLEGKAIDELSIEDMEKLDFEVFYNLTWVLAKTANPTIPDPITWLDQFETFPYEDIMPQLQDIIASTMSSKKK